MPVSRRRSAPDPIRDSLVEVRRGLLRLHKALIDAERRAFERGRGQVTNAQLLQALIDDPFFAWLRPYSRLIVEIDEALAGAEPVTLPDARGYVEQVRSLVSLPDDNGGQPPSRFDEVRSHNSDVLLAHIELSSRIQSALDYYRRL